MDTICFVLRILTIFFAIQYHLPTTDQEYTKSVYFKAFAAGLLFLKYLIFLALICSLILLRAYVGQLLQEALRRFEEPAYYYLIISQLLSVCIGLFLGLEHLIDELKKEGRWKLNLPKLLLIGLPSSFFSLAHIWFGFQFLNGKIAYTLVSLFGPGTDFILLFQIILGYVIITSPYKYNEKFLM